MSPSASLKKSNRLILAVVHLLAELDSVSQNSVISLSHSAGSNIGWLLSASGGLSAVIPTSTQLLKSNPS